MNTEELQAAQAEAAKWKAKAEARLETIDNLEAANDQLAAEVAKLRKAVLNQCGDNLCWVVTPETVKALPEAEFMESCRRYRQQIADERGEFSGGKTIAQLEAEAVRLREVLTKIRRTPAIPFPDPGAHSERAFSDAVWRAWSIIQHITDAALSDAAAPRDGGAMNDLLTKLYEATREDH